MTMQKNTLVKLVIISVALVLFIIVSALTMTGVFDSFEAWAFRVADDVRSPGMTLFLQIVYWFGTWRIIYPVAFLLFVIPYTRRRFGCPICFAVVITFLTSGIMKIAFNRDRPYGYRGGWPYTQSFPSGHTQVSTTFYLAIAVILIVMLIKHRKRKLLPILAIPTVITCFFLSVALGLSRVYVGVHFLGDVLAGWAAAVVVTLGMLMLWEFIGTLKIWKKFPRIHAFFYETPEPENDEFPL